MKNTISRPIFKARDPSQKLFCCATKWSGEKKGERHNADRFTQLWVFCPALPRAVLVLDVSTQKGSLLQETTIPTIY